MTVGTMVLFFVLRWMLITLAPLRIARDHFVGTISPPAMISVQKSPAASMVFCGTYFLSLICSVLLKFDLFFFSHFFLVKFLSSVTIYHNLGCSIYSFQC